MNKAILIGRLGKDPELTYTQAGKAVCKFSMATSRRWTDKKDGSKKEKTAWHNIVVWDGLAKICGQYLAKGRQVAVEGEIDYREYEKDGIKRYFTEIKATQVYFIGDNGQRERVDGGQRESASGLSDAAEPNKGGAPAAGGFSQADLDDCPF
jgi:single-strand DNA-binding protein